MGPNFIYIGVARAGSTYIYEVLRHHPDVFIPRAKELHFFSDDKNYQLGINWYLDFFENGIGKTAIGEIDHDIILDRKNLERVKLHFPDIKIIFCLREPIKKTFSQYLFWKFGKLNPNQTFLEYALNPKTVQSSDYYTLLIPVFELFNREQILILFYEDLKKSPHDFLNKIYDFLKIKRDYFPSIVEKKINPMRISRAQFLTQFGFRVYVYIKKHKWYNVIGRLKYNSILNWIFFKKVKSDYQIDANVVEQLKPIYHVNLVKLSKLLNTSLPTDWID